MRRAWSGQGRHGRTPSLGAMIAVLFAAALSSPSRTRAQSSPIDIARLIAERRDPGAVADGLRRLYRPDAQPLWIAADGPTRAARATIALLENAAVYGLDPRDYGADALHTDATGMTVAGRDDPRAAGFDVALSAAVLRFAAHLHHGRVDPRALGLGLTPESGADVTAAVRAMSRGTNIDSIVVALSPPYTGYLALQRAMARYEALAADTTLRVPALVLRRSVRLGDSLVIAPALRRLLIALGDLLLQPDAIAASQQYDTTLAAAVARFQARHGLEPDSILGPATMAAVRVPLGTRVRQMALTLERWRWLPHDAPSRYAIVNIPSFELSAFTSDSGSSCPVLVMKAIVGQAAGHRTPVFTSVMREVIFRPYWDVPLRIARQELLPLIRRDPDYLRREHMQVVRGGETDAVVYAPTRTNLDAVAEGRLRLRQLPGPWNALGLVKFVFPNPYDVYLHGTPQQKLFDEVRRDFSHGCMRLEDPSALAELVLRGQDGWDRATIETAMQGELTRHIPVARPMAVFVMYATAVATGDEMTFFPDVYGHDATLTRALGH